MNNFYHPQWIHELLTECDEAESAAPLAIHRFNPSIAVDYGIPAALAVQYVHDRCHKSGLKGVLTTIDSKSEQVVTQSVGPRTSTSDKKLPMKIIEKS